MARTESFKLLHIMRLKLLRVCRQLKNKSRTRLLVFIWIYNFHSFYGLGKVSMYGRAPIVAGVSCGERSVSPSTSSTCIVCKEASDDDWMVFENL